MFLYIFIHTLNMILLYYYPIKFEYISNILGKVFSVPILYEFLFFLVVSCGILSTPSNGRKSTFAFTPGTMVKFDCDPGYVLTGERRRWCYDNGDWNWAENGEAYCVRKSFLI